MADDPFANHLRYRPTKCFTGWRLSPSRVYKGAQAPVKVWRIIPERRVSSFRHVNLCVRDTSLVLIHR
jgi:hypothetical protein